MQYTLIFFESGMFRGFIVVWFVRDGFSFLRGCPSLSSQEVALQSNKKHRITHRLRHVHWSRRLELSIYLVALIFIAGPQQKVLSKAIGWDWDIY